MTSVDEVWERVRSVIVDVFGDDDVVLGPETTADDVDGWDSVSNLEVMIALEREFGIRFSTGEMASIENVGQLVERIATHVARDQAT